MTNIEIQIIGRFLESPFDSEEMYESLAELIGLYDARKMQYEKA